MYLTKKDRKIQTQQRIIERLEEENRCLKEQLKMHSSETIENRIKFTEQAYQEYMGLIEELNEMKQEYVKLIEEMTADKKEIKKKYK